MNKHNVHHAWLILATYGVWFALFSGLEEMVSGKYWKVATSLMLGVIVYLVIELKKK